jgi:hypothetical protein
VSLQVAFNFVADHQAIVATGARAAAPPIPGLEETGYLTNEHFKNAYFAAQVMGAATPNISVKRVFPARNISERLTSTSGSPAINAVRTASGSAASTMEVSISPA